MITLQKDNKNNKKNKKKSKEKEAETKENPQLPSIIFAGAFLWRPKVHSSQVSCVNLENVHSAERDF